MHAIGVARRPRPVLRRVVHQRVVQHHQRPALHLERHRARQVEGGGRLGRVELRAPGPFPLGAAAEAALDALGVGARDGPEAAVGGGAVLEGPPEADDGLRLRVEEGAVLFVLFLCVEGEVYVMKEEREKAVLNKPKAKRG